MTFRRALGAFDATMIVVGGIIGAGIFINPYIVAQRLDSSGLVLAAWAVGGTVALIGAFAWAELGAMFPRAGGQYVYLRDGWHPLAGFLYGWALLWMIESGALAAVALTFAHYSLRLVGRPDAAAAPLAVAALVIVSVVNYYGVKPGSRLLNVFVVLKIAALGLLIALGFLAPAQTSPPVAAVEPAGTFLPILFGAALIPILFSYGGWQNANYVAEEIKNPRRNLPLSLVAGTALVVVIYMLVNIVYLRTLGHAGLAATMTPASDAAARALGGAGDRFVAAAIAISTFGFLNLGVLAPTRVYYAMAADGLFFSRLARLHPVHRTPSFAIVLQSGWSILLLLTGTYAQLVDYVVFADWIFFGLTAASVFVFRRLYPPAERPPGSFLMPGYPVTPILFVMVAVLVVGSAIWANPWRSGMGALLLAVGVPVFLWWRRSGSGAAAGRFEK
jgi:basic amino acid/polyamine antiporter, APA family